jgi:hypothetical protein
MSGFDPHGVGGAGDSAFRGGGSDDGFSRDGAQEPVGSVGEEAAKLLAALQVWLGEHVGDRSQPSSGLGSAYISDGSAACRVCPVCQLIAFVRGINPESMEQLTHAAGSMLQALSGLVDAAHSPDARRGEPVQKINLSDDEDDTDPEEPKWD